MIDLDAIRCGLAAAYPGPWRFRPELSSSSNRWTVAAMDYDVATHVGYSDAQFIACAREDVEDLVDEVERLQMEMGEAEARFEGLAQSNRQLARAGRRPQRRERGPGRAVPRGRRLAQPPRRVDSPGDRRAGGP